MELLKIVVICNNDKWCEQLELQISNYDSLTVAGAISDFKDLDAVLDQHKPDILITDLDLLISTGYRYDYIYNRIRCWEPKLPFVMAIGDNDHRAINKGQMRYGVDFWNNKTPEDGSVKDVALILNDLAPLLFEAKNVNNAVF